MLYYRKKDGQVERMEYRETWKKVQRRFDKIRMCVIPALEAMYLFMLVLLTVYYTLILTNTNFSWENLAQEEFFPAHFLLRYFLLEPQYILLAIAVLRHLFSESYDWREILAAIVIGRCAFYAYEQIQYVEWLTMIMLMLGAKGSSFRKVVKIHFLTRLSVFICVVIAAQIGLIENLVYQIRTERMAFGFVYPTEFAAYIFFLILWYWYLRGEEWTYAECFLPLFGSIFVKVFSDARASSYLMAALFVVMIYYVWQRKRAERMETKYQMNKGFSYLLAGSMLLCAILTMVLSILYTPENAAIVKLDQILSSRLSLSKKGMDIYGFTLWGTWVRLLGNGGYLSGNRVYFFIDSVFMQFAIQYGAVMMSMVLALFWWIGVRARKYRQWILLWLMAFIAVHGIVEPNVFKVAYNPMIFAAFTVMDQDSGLQLKRRRKKKK